MSFYARGQVGKLDYRLVLSDPFPVASNGNVGGPVAGDLVRDSGVKGQVVVQYQILF